MLLSKVFDQTSKKSAIIVSYIALVLNTLSSIFLTRILLKILGTDEYGLYQMVNSVAHYVMILDLGISTVMVRYISEYRAKEDKEGEQNIAAIIGIFSAIGIVLVIIVGLIIRYNIGNIYQSLNKAEVAISKQMVTVMICQFAFTIVNHYLVGAIQSYERFLYSSLVSMIGIIASFCITVLMVKFGFGCVGITLANLISIGLQMLINGIMAFGVLKFRVRLKHWDRVLVKPIIGLMLAMLLQAIVGNVNSSVDKTLLGMFSLKEDVTKYSLAATILTMFNTIPGIISGFFQPQITRMIVKKANPSELTDVVIRVGRWQFMLVGAFFSAFILFGIDFVTIWTSTNNIAFTVWLIVVMIMPANMIPLIQTVCISIMNGYDKRMYRSLILFGMTILNIILSIILIRAFGPLGAPIGTVISYLVGNGFALNVYYSKVLRLEIGRMFKSIFRKTWFIILATSCICSPFILIDNSSISMFLLECVCYCIVYGVLLLKFGFNSEEKTLVIGLIGKVLHKSWV